jgi:hypothetical protein
MIEKTYERVARKLLSNQRKNTKPFAWFDGRKLHSGLESMHKTAVSRMWRTFWRMKQRR